MATPAHKKNTQPFSNLSFADQARSINAMINNLQNAIKHHIRHSQAPNATREKCLDQIQRLLIVIFSATIISCTRAAPSPENPSPADSGPIPTTDAAPVPAQAQVNAAGPGESAPAEPTTTPIHRETPQPAVVEAQPQTQDAERTVDDTRDAAIFVPLRTITEDLHEFTRLSDATAMELAILVDDYRRELERLAQEPRTAHRDSVMAAYSRAYKMYDDSSRVWDVFEKAPQLLANAKTEFRRSIQQRAVMQGPDVDNSDLVDGIAAFEFIIQKGHAPNTLFPSNSRFTTGLTDICERYPDLAGEFQGYTFIKHGSVGSIWWGAEESLATIHPNWDIESAPPYLQLQRARSPRLAERIAVRYREHARREAEVQAEQQRKARAEESAREEREAVEETAKQTKAAASKLRIAKQFIETGNHTAAKKWLEELLRDYSQTPAAQEAKELLRTLE